MLDGDRMIRWFCFILSGLLEFLGGAIFVLVRSDPVGMYRSGTLLSLGILAVGMYGQWFAIEVMRNEDP